MNFVPALFLCLVLSPALTGCTGGSDAVAAAATEAAVRREAGTAIALARQAVAGGAPRADAGWRSCVAGMAWTYEGGGTFPAAPGADPARNVDQLAAIRAALVRAGYADTVQIAGKVADQVVVERGGVSFVIYPRPPIARSPALWTFSYRSRCAPLPRADRDHADSPTRPRDPIAP